MRRVGGGGGGGGGGGMKRKVRDWGARDEGIWAERGAEGGGAREGRVGEGAKMEGEEGRESEA